MSLSGNTSLLASRLATEIKARPLNPLRTQILPHSNGGLGGSVTASLGATTTGSARMVVKLPVDCNKWRLKIRNRDSNETAKTAGVLKKLVVGQHASPSSSDNLGAETGSFVGNAATTLLSTDTTIPGDGNYAVTNWMTAPGSVFTANSEWLLGYGYTFASSTAVQTGAGKAWYWANSTSATDPTIPGSNGTVVAPPFDWVIEYEATTRNKVTLVIGDSIFEPIAGAKGTTSASIVPTPLWKGNVYLWGAQTGRSIVNMSLAGFKLSDYAFSDITNVTVAHLWNRLGLTGYTIDELLICGGSNDIFGASATLAGLQQSVRAIVTRAQSFGFAGKVYLGTVISRTTTNDSVRLAYNDWIGGQPGFCDGVVDFAGAMRGTSGTALWPDYTTDTIHPSWLGHRRMATELRAALP